METKQENTLKAIETYWTDHSFKISLDYKLDRNISFNHPILSNLMHLKELRAGWVAGACNPTIQ